MPNLPKVVIAAGGIITALGRALGYGDRIDHLPVLRTPGRIDLATCLNMKLSQTVGVGRLWLSHHGRALFFLPNLAKTTITCPSNLLYDDAVDSEPGGVEGGGVPGARHGLTQMRMMMMTRMHLEYIVIGGRLLLVPTVSHLASLPPLLLGP